MNSSLLSFARCTSFIALALCGASGCSAAQSSTDTDDESAASAVTPAYEVTLSTTDSAGAKAFLRAFVPTFQEIVTRDVREDASGASSRDEIDEDIYRARRNDGSIECRTVDRKDTCLFKLRPQSLVNGEAISKGDRNTWAGQLHSSFRENIVVAASGDGESESESDDTIVIGNRAKRVFITCAPAGSERGLATSACTFHLR